MVGPTDLVERLRSAVVGRANWYIEDPGVAVYRPPGATHEVRVRPIQRPDERRRHNFHAALLRHGQIANTAQCFSADEATVLLPARLLDVAMDSRGGSIGGPDQRRHEHGHRTTGRRCPDRG